LTLDAGRWLLVAGSASDMLAAVCFACGRRCAFQGAQNADRRMAEGTQHVGFTATN